MATNGKHLPVDIDAETGEEIKPSRIRPMAIETKRLAKFLADHSKKRDYETVIRYEDMNRVLGLPAGDDVREHRHWLITAIRILNREGPVDLRLKDYVSNEDRPCPIWFANVRQQGVKLATDFEREAYGAACARLSSRAARRGGDVLLPAAPSAMRDALLSQSGLVRHVTSRTARDRILVMAEKAGQITVMESLKLLCGPSAKKAEERK